MRRRVVGPLPLTDGLQLEAAEGRPSGLLRALNMESRGGLCRTRRGQERLCDVSVATGNQVINASGGSFNDALTILEVPMPAGASPLGNVRPGTRATMIFSARYDNGGFDPFQQTAESYLDRVTLVAGDVEIDCDFAVIREWTRFETSFPSLDSVGIFPFTLDGSTTGYIGPDPSKLLLVSVIWPDGIDVAATSPADDVLIRLTFTDPLVFDNEPNVLNLDVVAMTAHPASLLDATTRKRKATLAFGPSDFADLGTTLRVVDVDTGLAVGTSTQAFREFVRSIYVPWTDEILITADGHLMTFDCDQLDTAVQALADFVPETDVEQFSDIAVESVIPGATVLAIFGGRPFLFNLTDLGPGSIRWGAPNEFWTVFPSANVAQLGATRSTGAVVAARELDGELIIFTDGAIWRAVLADPTAGNESDLFIQLVEETGCISGESVVGVDGGIVFASDDGVRMFRRGRSKIISSAVRSLFRRDKDVPYGMSQSSRACAVWHRVENRYELFYSSPGAEENDTVLVVDLDEGTCWLWGCPLVSAADTPAEEPDGDGPFGPRRRGIRAQAATWCAARNGVVIMDATGLVLLMDEGTTDFESPIEWSLESQTIGMGRAERGVLERLELLALRENFGTFDVGAVPDGDSARTDTRRVGIDPDRLDTATAIGSASMEDGVQPLRVEDSFAPISARFRLQGRNFRLRVSSVGPAYDPVALATYSATLTVEEKPR